MTIAWDVTKIKANDMDHCTSMITIIFEQNSILDTIGEYAFSDRIIQEIHFPSSLRVIEQKAFIRCQSLETLGLELAANLETIGEEAFSYCSKLHTVNLVAAQNLVSFGFGAFDYSGLSDIDLSLATNLKTIGMSSFRETQIEHVTFPRQLVTIETYSFYGCPSLQSLNFSQAHSLVLIGYWCFGYCPVLTHTIVFPPSLEQIDVNAFYCCLSLQGVVIPACSNLISVGGLAFYSCTDLVRFEIKEGGKVIDFGSLAFHMCSSLEFFSCHSDSTFQYPSSNDHKLATVVFHGAPTKSSPAVQYMSSVRYPAKPVFMVPSGYDIEGLTVATLEFFNYLPSIVK